MHCVQTEFLGNPFHRSNFQLQGIISFKTWVFSIKLHFIQICWAERCSKVFIQPALQSLKPWLYATDFFPWESLKAVQDYQQKYRTWTCLWKYTGSWSRSVTLTWIVLHGVFTKWQALWATDTQGTDSKNQKLKYVVLHIPNRKKILNIYISKILATAWFSELY